MNVEKNFNRVLAVKLHNFTAECCAEITLIRRFEKVSKLCKMSGECDEIT